MGFDLIAIFYALHLNLISLFRMCTRKELRVNERRGALINSLLDKVLPKATAVS